MKFPIVLDQYIPVRFSLSQSQMLPNQKEQLGRNIKLIRNSIVFVTAYASAKGLGGHTGGAFDIVPELLIIDGFIKGGDYVYPVFFDEAGHRVAIQYVMSAITGLMPPEALLHYREFDKGLYGHPERNDNKGIFFSSGRLGHMWSYVNGIAAANPHKSVIMFGSDGSQQEGGDAEAARYAVAQGLNVKLLIDDNDVTIAGHPSNYMKGFDVLKTLRGHGLSVDSGNGEDVDALFERIRKALTTSGPCALVNRRKMAPGIHGIEGLPKGHDVIPVNLAISYLKRNGYDEAVKILETPLPKPKTVTYKGSTPEQAKNRDDFGKYICEILKNMRDRKERVIVVDSDLEGSCGLHHIREAYPEVYVNGGIMERNNFSVAAGFGATAGKQGIFATFSAFLEMVISEITMARLNRANVLAHFSHAGVDDMADNTCHFGINAFFADNGLLENDATRLYYPADSLQLKAVLSSIFFDKGLRFIFSTRSGTPFILSLDGKRFFEEGYTFIPGKDDLIREGSDGYIVTYGEMLYRCLDIVEDLKTEGMSIGLINKTTLNVIDEDMLKRIGPSKAILVVETQNVKTGLGARMGTWLLERGHHPRFACMGTRKEGRGGLSEQIPYQGMDKDAIRSRITALIK
jgi:transketolase C-terminal domain/subunit/transketolase N-terminal domain/subunit